MIINRFSIRLLARSIQTKNFTIEVIGEQASKHLLFDFDRLRCNQSCQKSFLMASYFFEYYLHISIIFQYKNVRAKD